MDARGVDRPAAVVRPGSSPLLRALVTELAHCGYDVHLPVVGSTASGDGGDGRLLGLPHHPRLHPVPVGPGTGDPEDQEDPDAALRRSLHRQPGSLALLVTTGGRDLFAELRLVHALMGPLHDASVLVLGPPLASSTRAHLRGAGLPATVTTLASGGRRPAGLLGPAATARRAVEAARRGLPHLACGRSEVHEERPGLLASSEPARMLPDPAPPQRPRR